MRTFSGTNSPLFQMIDCLTRELEACFLSLTALNHSEYESSPLPPLCSSHLSMRRSVASWSSVLTVNSSSFIDRLGCENTEYPLCLFIDEEGGIALRKVGKALGWEISKWWREVGDGKITRDHCAITLPPHHYFAATNLSVRCTLEIQQPFPLKRAIRVKRL